MTALSFSTAAKIEFLTFPRLPRVETGSPGSEASGDFLIDSLMYFRIENAARDPGDPTGTMVAEYPP